ncbi:MAG: hypothetical protein M3069_24890, partial [Chloroflexota bacterium]|nr:hypothetical protein [Chloroflexota bacterium]
MKATQHVVRAVKGLAKHKVFAVGPDVCIFYDLLTDNPVPMIAIADWYHVDGARIASIRTNPGFGSVRLHRWRDDHGSA